jgi:hypothetical protein
MQLARLCLLHSDTHTVAVHVRSASSVRCLVHGDSSAYASVRFLCVPQATVLQQKQAQ